MQRIAKKPLGRFIFKTPIPKGPTKKKRLLKKKVNSCGEIPVSVALATQSVIENRYRHWG